MAWVDVTRGLSELRRQLRKTQHALRNYHGRTQMFLKAGGAAGTSEEKQVAQALFAASGAAWRQLPEASKPRWKAYAKKHGKLMGDQKYKDFSAWDVYQPAFRNRALLGLDPAQLPVNEPPPPAVASVEQVATDDPRTFTFRIRHSAPADDHMLLVRITPATVSVARKPVTRDLRLICGQTAQSLASLPRSGHTVTFTNAQFAIAPEERYGIELRIVRTEDGIHSRPLFVDLLRPATPSST